MKRNYPHHILFFRLGDFYEMFFDDAITASRVLELTLTGRDCGLAERAPMCGVPHHSAEVYIKRLIAAGYKVAVCEQLTTPCAGKGIVIRDVIRVVSPGTVIESSMLDEGVNNYLCCIYAEKGFKSAAVCFADISTGELNLFPCKGKNIGDELVNHLACYRPAEVLVNSEVLSLGEVTKFINTNLFCSVTLLDDICFSPNASESKVFAQLKADSFDEIGIHDESESIACLCGLFDYISESQKALIGRFTEVILRNDDDHLILDHNARRNLELTETMRTKERKGSLLWVLDKTCTSMGKRLLKSWIEQPLYKPHLIIERLDAVETLVNNVVALGELQSSLSSIYDLERLMTRVVYKTANPRDLRALCVTAVQLPFLKAQLSELDSSKLLQKLNSEIDKLEDIANLIGNSIVDEPPITHTEGNVIRDGFNKELDELRQIMNNGSSFIEKLEQRERERTGIKGLKAGFNRVFGYYFEVTKSYYDLVPPEYIRKQTLANCERFITQELKEAENTILGAKEKSIQLEEQIFLEIREYAAKRLEAVQKTAGAVAAVDVLCSFAEISSANMYVKPEITIDGVIEIKDGRHPVVEKVLDGEIFVPNNAYMDTSSNRMLILTGPNMSGKSTYMRQNALIVIMAQTGCFVPASSARISVVDRLFTRVGASDDLTAGQSTFMVEMSEVADILKYATKNSLVILDEVGRGTSTFDGISIARAVAEYICTSKKLGCKTLFATHYHELISLEGDVEGVKNFSVAVRRNGEDIRFLRKIVPGGVDDSFGIEVARLSGVPQKVIKRARELLKEMETEKPAVKVRDAQISFSAIGNDMLADTLRKTNPSELSDEECRKVLEELVKKAGS